MKKSTKIFVIIIVILFAAGLVLMALGLMTGANRWIYLDKSGPHLSDAGNIYEINEHNLNSFSSIDIDVSYNNIEFVDSDNFGLEIHSYNNITWSLENGDLKINGRNSPFDYFNFNLGFMGINNYTKDCYIKVYMPTGTKLSDLTLKTGAGNITAGSFTAENADISSSFGDITLDSFTAGSLSLSLSSGDFIGGDIEVNNNIQFKNSNGDGTFSGTKAESLNMQSSNGDITINDSTINSVNLQDSNGKISSDKLTTGAIVANLSNGSINLSGDFTGNLDIKSTNGGISLTTWEKQSYYLCDFKTSLGSIKLGGSKSGNIYTNNSKSTNIFKIRNSNGDITVNFAEE